MSDLHPLMRWAERRDLSIDEVAERAGCTPSHLRNLFAGRKGASLSLAKRLSTVSEGEVPMDAFLRPAEPAQ